MKKILLFTIALSSFASLPLLADTPATAAKPTAAKPAKLANPIKMTCKEFLEFDEMTRPQIVYWSEGYSKKGKPDQIVIDVDQTNRLVPVLVEDCTNEPSASFWSKLKMEFKKLF
jgi:HdeA/HdeB family